MSLDLFITRAGVSPPEYLGHVVRIPAVPSPEAMAEAKLGAKDLDGLEDALFVDRLAGVGKPARVIPWGILEPTAWERRFVAWVSRRLGVSAEAGWDALASTDANPSFKQLGTALSDPLADLPSSTGVILLAGDDPELEAIGAARAIRKWLAPQPEADWPAALDDVLVLLPSSPSRRALWRETLERHGLAAEAHEAVALDATPLGLWLLALARVERWREGDAVSRADLRLALLSPFATYPEGARRRDVRECLRSLRAYSVDLATWRRHVAGHFAEVREAIDAGGELTRDERSAARAAVDDRERGFGSLTTVLVDPATRGRLFHWLVALLEAWKVRERVRASGHGPSIAVAERARRVLDRLAREPDEEAPALERLREALAGESVRMDVAPTHGIRIQSYAQFDGRPARFVVLAGLEEAGWPATPPRRTRKESELATALGLEGSAAELARQARIAAAAARKAKERVLLTWSRTDEAGSQTFAGPLLAAIRKEKGGLPEEVVTELEAVPARPSALATPADVLPSPWPEVGAALDGVAKAAWQRGADAARRFAQREEARAPLAETPIGPFTGEVGVPLVGAGRFSPTSLESLGQCPAKYFLGRILGLEEKTDADVELDAAEVGSVLHAALADCAQKAIASKGAWQLSGSSSDDLEATVEEAAKKVEAALDARVASVSMREPTLASALVTRLADRWKLALRNWLRIEVGAPEGVLFEGGATTDPLKLTKAQLANLDEETLKVVQRARESGLEEAKKLITRARKAPAKSKAEGARWHGGASQDVDLTILPKGKFSEAAAIAADATRASALDELERGAESEYAARLEKASKALEELYHADRLAVARRVIGTEWSFGDAIGEDVDGASTEKPLVLDLPGSSEIALRGRVDRIDAAEDRPDLAVVDYKTGAAKNENQLFAELGEGRHLQLPIYAAAVESLRTGKGGVSKKARVVLGRLTFPKVGKESGVPLEEGLARPYVAKGETEELGPQEVLRAHLAHSLRRLETGTLALLPRACPPDKGAYCDFIELCDFRADHRESFSDPDPQPLFTAPPRPPKEAKPEPPVEVEYPPASPVATPPTAEAGAKVHAAGRALARDLARDVTLSAGAGTGKTTSLVDRYVEALRAGCEPEEILCITFTRKATAEMRSRVRSRVLELSKGSAEERRRWIAGVSCAPIHTIDAFAAVVVNELEEQVVEVAASIKEAAAEFTAERLAEEAGKRRGDLDRLYREWPPSKVREVLIGLLLQERTLRDHRPASAAEILEGWEQEARRLSPGFEAVTVSLLAECSSLAKRASGKDAEALPKIVDSLEAVRSATQALGVLVGLEVLSKAGVPRHKSLSDEGEELRSRYRSWRDQTIGWFKKVHDVLSTHEEAEEIRAHLEAEAATTHAALTVAAGWLEPFDRFREERSLLTFPEVIARATAALGEVGPADVAARFPFRHVLVDEFQDTDSGQIAFVDRLVERIRKGAEERGCSLFVVGDPKQSIYRFRGAEVDLFEERTDDADAGLGHLTTCYRARAPLTRAVDRLFERLFAGTAPDGGPLDAEAAVPWQPLSPMEDSESEPCVELLGSGVVAEAAPEVLREDADEAEEDGAESSSSEAAGAEDPEGSPMEQALVRRIRTLLADAASSTRPGEPPIAILTHSWARAAHYGHILQRHGIPAFVQGGRGLLETREVRDLLWWLKALERQDDAAAFVGILRGATIGLSDPGLYCLRRGFGLSLRSLDSDREAFVPAAPSTAFSRLALGFQFDAEAALAQLKEARAKPVSTRVREAVQADAARLAVFARAWRAAASRFGLTPATEVLDGIVAETAFDAALRARWDGLQALANVRAFRALVREAQAGATPSELVRTIERLASEGDGPAIATLNLSPGAAVLVTVVHQAKGREWDTVIVPDLEKVELRGRVERCDLVRLARPAKGGWSRKWLAPSVLGVEAEPFAAAGGAGARVLTAATLGAERAESRRLLYVAMTRARKKLVLTAEWPGAKELAGWANRRGPLGLPVATNWMEDLVFALKSSVSEDGKLLPTDVWKEERDFRWIVPEGTGFGEAAVTATSKEEVDAAAVRVAAKTVPDVPLRIVTPSSLPADPAHPKPSLTRSAAKGPAGASPFASADQEGTAFHRAAQLWSYEGPCDRGTAERAVRSTCGEHQLQKRATRIEELLEWIATAHPALVAELEAAARRGELHHEVAVGHLQADGSWFEGSVDLLYRDAAGAWHVLDYKTNRISDEATLTERIADYHAQVAAYAEGLRGRLPGGASVASYGLWFVTAGVVARWEAK